MKVQFKFFSQFVGRLSQLHMAYVIQCRKDTNIIGVWQASDANGLLSFTRCFVFIFLCVTYSATSFPQQIAGGGCHSLFICEDGTVMAYGCNTIGQLGDGTTTNRFTPVQVMGLTDIVAVSASWGFSLFLKNDGTVWACGENDHGQLGDGTTTRRLTPVQVSGLTDVIAIAAGGYHSLFLKKDGTVWACGSLPSGNGYWSDILTPVQVAGLTDIKAIAAGEEHSLFLKNDGTVWAYGGNMSGQLGDGTTTARFTPVSVYGLNNIKAIAAGNTFSIFLKNDGTVWFCGLYLCTHTGCLPILKVIPIKIGGVDDIIAISASAGGDHSLFLKNDGTVWGQGWNFFGQLGDGTFITRYAPVPAIGLSDIVAIAAGSSHSLFLKNDGTIWSCGDNTYGQLGDSSHWWGGRTVPEQLIPPCFVTPFILEAHFAENMMLTGPWPNPTNNELNFTLASPLNGKVKIFIFNALGQLVKSEVAGCFEETRQISILLDGLVSGTYILQVSINDTHLPASQDKHSIFRRFVLK